MSIHIPWADEAQLTEVSTDTRFVGPLRDCLRLYANMPADARSNALILADAAVLLPGRASTKVLEHSQIEALISAFDGDQIKTPAIEELIERRRTI